MGIKKKEPLNRTDYKINRKWVKNHECQPDF